MLNMENAEEVMQILERFTRLKQKEIPKELDDYMNYVAKTGDTVFKWSSLKYLFREKLLNVIKNFHDTSPRVDDLPQYPNVDPFNYESMKSSLLERLELFNAAPFTIQRLCELLTEPRKQYSRIDKFMRALEKNILVVSTIEPGRKRTESENGDSLDSVVNGDASLDVNVDIDMENEPIFNAEPPNATSSTNPSSQPSSNLIHKTDDDILPNPKKPKLDLDETADAETEAATKSIISNKTDTAEASVEKVVLDESADITDKKKKEDRVAEENTVSEEKPTAVNATATAEVAVVAVDFKKDVKDSECEKMEEDSPAAAPKTENNNVADKKEEAESKAEEKVEPVITSKPAEAVVVDMVSPPTSTPEVVAAVEAIKTAENPQKIDDAPEGNKKDCAEKIVEEQAPAKDGEVEKEIKVNDDNKENHNGEIKENEEKTETSIITANSEKVDATKPFAAPEKAIAANKEEKSEEISKEKVEEVAVTPVAVVVEDSKKEVAETSKTEVIPSAMPAEPSKTEEAKPANESVIAAEAVSVSAEEIKETTTINTAEPVAKIVVAEPTPSATESLQKESPETPVEIKPSEQKENETEKDKEIPVALATAPPTESKDEAVPVPVVVAAEPVVTADQPMEENPETIAEPVVPIIVVEAAANVEEIEMATDVIEPAKDEPAGMEVDDTSQEAMDQ